MTKELYRAGKTKVKICGITKEEDITYVNSSCPDYIGFVFARKSRRYITYNDAAKLRQNLKTSIQTVGVFVDENPEILARLLHDQIIDIAQLHGNEDEKYLKELRRLTDHSVIQAIRISDRDDLLKAQESSADYLLFDSSNAGSGITFDWSLLCEIKRPYFLAGGLNPRNVKDALMKLTPYAVDVSSGVETEYRKDNEKIKQFVQAVRNRNRNGDI